MRSPSRSMPKIEQKTLGAAASVCVLLLMLLLLALPGLKWWPLMFVFPALVVILSLHQIYRDRNIRKSRADLGICEFTRSLNYREIDTWIIRAVYEEFSKSYPVKISDSFEKDLCLDWDDLEDSIEAIATRTGVSLAKLEQNIYFEKIETVGDFVMFLQLQPKLHMG